MLNKFSSVIHCLEFSGVIYFFFEEDNGHGCSSTAFVCYIDMHILNGFAVINCRPNRDAHTIWVTGFIKFSVCLHDCRYGKILGLPVLTRFVGRLPKAYSISAECTAPLQQAAFDFACLSFVTPPARLAVALPISGRILRTWPYAYKYGVNRFLPQFLLQVDPFPGTVNDKTIRLPIIISHGFCLFIC